MKKRLFLLVFMSFFLLKIFADETNNYPSMSPETQLEMNRLLNLYPKIDLSYPIYAFNDQRDCSSDEYAKELNLVDGISSNKTHRVVSLANCGGNFVTPLKDQLSRQSRNVRF